MTLPKLPYGTIMKYIATAILSIIGYAYTFGKHTQKEETDREAMAKEVAKIIPIINDVAKHALELRDIEKRVARVEGENVLVNGQLKEISAKLTEFNIKQAEVSTQLIYLNKNLDKIMK